MKKIIIFLILFVLFPACMINSGPRKEIGKPVILIGTCGGGGGHTSATNSIAEALKNDYQIKTVNPFTEIFGWKYGEDLYNFLLRNRLHWLINKYSDFGSKWIHTHQRKLNEWVFNYLKQHKPDMIISVIPYINNIFLDMSKKLNVPFLAIPTDLNTETFALGINSPNYDKFVFSLAFDDPLSLERIKQFNIPKKNIKFVGYPLRKSFFEKKDKEKIKEEFSIPKDKPVIMILMGAEGSMAIYSYVYNLAKSKLPIHLVICIGRNENLREKIKRIRFYPNVTKSVFGFTDRISDLLAASDLFITKPGSHSVCEAIQMGIPLFLDQTSAALNWEKLNGDFIKKYELGEVVKSYRKVPKLVEKYISDPQLKVKLKVNFAKFKRESFAKPVKELVDQMMKK